MPSQTQCVLNAAGLRTCAPVPKPTLFAVLVCEARRVTASPASLAAAHAPQQACGYVVPQAEVWIIINLHQVNEAVFVRFLHSHSDDRSRTVQSGCSGHWAVKSFVFIGRTRKGIALMDYWVN